MTLVLTFHASTGRLKDGWELLRGLFNRAFSAPLAIQACNRLGNESYLPNFTKVFLFAKAQIIRLLGSRE